MLKHKYDIMRVRRNTGVWIRAFATVYGMSYTEAMHVMAHHFGAMTEEQRKDAVAESCKNYER